jgi:hypothetical protein
LFRKERAMCWFALVSIDGNEARVGLTARFVEDGKLANSGPVEEQISAQSDETLQPAGTADVTAMGRSFRCRVFEGTAGLGPCSGDGPFTIYFCDEVPGGIVKYVGDGPGGDPMTLTAAALEVRR